MNIKQVWKLVYHKHAVAFYVLANNSESSLCNYIHIDCCRHTDKLSIGIRKEYQINTTGM